MVLHGWSIIAPTGVDERENQFAEASYAYGSIRR
jgi:hypothetical protein